VKKLTKKERGEVVTKGYLFDSLDERDYVTKDFLMNEFKPQFKNELKTELIEELQIVINDSFARHIQALMEDNHATIMTLIESFENRFERIEKHVGLLPA
jgi:hypothetical protein